MGVFTYCIKVNSQAGNIWVYVMTKQPKPQDTQLGVSKIYTFCQKI